MANQPEGDKLVSTHTYTRTSVRAEVRHADQGASIIVEVSAAGKTYQYNVDPPFLTCDDKEWLAQLVATAFLMKCNVKSGFAIPSDVELEEEVGWLAVALFPSRELRIIEGWLVGRAV